MTSLSMILEDVADIVKIANKKSVYKPRVLQEMKSVLGRFESVQAEIKKIVEHQKTSFKGGFRWLFKAKKVAELLLDMEGLESGLNTVLLIVRFAMERKTTISDSPK